MSRRPRDVEGVAAFAAGLGNVSRVDVLRFHKLGGAKWQALDIPFALHDTLPPTADRVARAAAVFEAQGLTAV
ncbi:hypothetical protein ACIA98_01770 [Streptomyces sp. NPDC051366]|uniref:hypothetical protein n=1 Tax=Streptomyces sp. NPDC051366 TaxID=3365652 RepID=UPI00379F684C